jgi:hypothetical protein
MPVEIYRVSVHAQAQGTLAQRHAQRNLAVVNQLPAFLAALTVLV